MTPARDAAIRRRAKQALAWAKRELEITEPMVTFDWDMPPEYYTIKDSEESRRFLDDRNRRYDEFKSRPDIAEINRYREWLYEVVAYCTHRTRHPIVRLIRKTMHIGKREYPRMTDEERAAQADRVLKMSDREPTYAFRWHYSIDTDDNEKHRTHARSLPMGDHIALGLPNVNHSGRAWFHWGHEKHSADVEWGVHPGTRPEFSFSLSVEGDRDLKGHVRLPFLGYLFFSLDRVVPDSWIPKKTVRFTTYEPYVFASEEEARNTVRKPVQHEYVQRQEVNLIEFRLDTDCITGALLNVSEPMQSDGKRRFYKFWPDFILGRNECTRTKHGPEVEAVACFPEGQYTLKLQREMFVWKRALWPWPYWRKSVNIEAVKPPEFNGKGENSWDLGPDAIHGMSSDGWDYYDAVAAYTKATLRERRRRGVTNPAHRTLLTQVARED